MLEKNREQFMYVDEIEARIAEILDTWKEDFITSRNIADELGDNINLVHDRKLAQKN
ncbi:hypothetical protein [Secundilactobacillus silagei]|uniref:hypothetical protein n=1 Tax=Secundilactobacillus silagei TaxID=1293415 RepID=UPI000AB109C3|nr:hypothetical protein [Secundilactobacillus silagei]